jgi:small-conductance mechanosensitive channel
MGVNSINLLVLCIFLFVGFMIMAVGWISGIFILKLLGEFIFSVAVIAIAILIAAKLLVLILFKSFAINMTRQEKRE